MGIAVYLFLIILGLHYPKSKAITLIMLIFMWITYGLNTDGGDFAQYKFLYENLVYANLLSHHEPGYTLVSFICLKFGFTYQLFRCVLATIYLGILYSAVKYYTTFTAYVFSLLMIFPFLLFVSVLRAGISTVIILYASRYLVSEKKKSGIKYIALVVIATIFHYSSIFFLVFLFAKKSKFESSSLFRSRRLLVLRVTTETRG